MNARPFCSRGLSLPLLVVLFLALSAGCVSMLSPGAPPVRLQIRPALPGNLGKSPINRQMAVAMPQAVEAVDSDSVMLLFNGRELRTLAGVRWASPVPSMVQRSLIEAVDSTGALRGVSDESAGLLVDARLITDIRDFSLHYADEKSPPTAVMEATFRVLSLNTGKVLATRSVKTQSRAGGTDNKALISAMERALGEALNEIAPWAVNLMRNSISTLKLR